MTKVFPGEPYENTSLTARIWPDQEGEPKSDLVLRPRRKAKAPSKNW